MPHASCLIGGGDTQEQKIARVYRHRRHCHCYCLDGRWKVK